MSHFADRFGHSGGADAPMRFRHTVHLLQHGYHFNWLTISLTVLLFGLLIAAYVYRRGRSGSGQSRSTYGPPPAAPWQSSTGHQAPGAPWQSGVAGAAAPGYCQPAFSPTPWAPPGSPRAWNTPQANSWQGPATAQWTR